MPTLTLRGVYPQSMASVLAYHAMLQAGGRWGAAKDAIHSLSPRARKATRERLERAEMDARMSNHRAWMRWNDVRGIPRRIPSSDYVLRAGGVEGGAGE